MRAWSLAALTLALTGLSLGASRAQSEGEGRGADGRGAHLRQACQADLDRLCSGVKGRAAFQCLREHEADASETCKTAMANMRGGGHHWRDEHQANGAPPNDGAAQSPPPTTPPQT